MKTARLKAFFRTQLSNKFWKSVMDMMNKRAAFEGAGEGGMTYTDYVAFMVPEVDKQVGLLFANGLSPKPSMDCWFLEGRDHPIWGNDVITPAMDKHRPRCKMVRGYRRWKQFRAFLCLYDFRLNVTKETVKNPLLKVKSLLDELNHNAKKCWRTGKIVLIDKETLGFQGKCGMKLRISYKAEGDGFQCDAVCDNG